MMAREIGSNSKGLDFFFYMKKFKIFCVVILFFNNKPISWTCLL